MDGEPGFEVDQVLATLRTHDHALIRFEILGHRLLIDFRASNEVEPAVLVLEPVRSLRERIATIRRARPALPIPEELRIIRWPLRVRSLERIGALDVVRERLAGLGAREALRQLAEAIAELETLERQEFRGAITGEGYQTLWPVSSR